MSDVSKTIDSMDAEAFEELARAVSDRSEAARSKPTLDDIKPGMSEANKKRVMEEIALQLKRMGR